MKLDVREIKNTFLILLGIFAAAFGLKGFLLSSHFIDGGVTGISMLLSQVLGWPLPLLLLVTNLPFIAIGYNQIGRKFAIKSALAIGGLALCLAVVKFPDVTQDRLLTAIFGGLFIGSGIGLAIRGGAVLDGTEVAALLISKRSHLLRVGDVVLLLNIAIFLTAAFFLSVEIALYSILTYFAASRMIDFLIHGLDEFTAITIVSTRGEALRLAITTDLRRSVTLTTGRGGLTGLEQDILYCVVTRLEIGSVKDLVNEIDPAAFVVTHALSDAQGGRLTKSEIH